MGSLVEERTRHFYRWERRGRGWRSYPFPVALEPPFAPFRFLRHAPAVDDGRHHTRLSGLLERLFGNGGTPAPKPQEEEVPEPEPGEEDEPPVELKLLLPKDLSVTPALAEHFLRQLGGIRAPLSFELVGAGGHVSVLFTAREGELPLLISPLRAFFPAVFCRKARITSWTPGTAPHGKASSRRSSWALGASSWCRLTGRGASRPIR